MTGKKKLYLAMVAIGVLVLPIYIYLFFQQGVMINKDFIAKASEKNGDIAYENQEVKISINQSPQGREAVIEDREGNREILTVKNPVRGISEIFWGDTLVYKGGLSPDGGAVAFATNSTLPLAYNIRITDVVDVISGACATRRGSTPKMFISLALWSLVFIDIRKANRPNVRVETRDFASEKAKFISMGAGLSSLTSKPTHGDRVSTILAKSNGEVAEDYGTEMGFIIRTVFIILAIFFMLGSLKI